MPRRPRGSASSTEAQAGGRRQSRTAFHFTCANCRNRKIKCDGGQPECRICLAYGERCHYDKPPPMTQVLAMAARIETLEKALAVRNQDRGAHAQEKPQQADGRKNVKAESQTPVTSDSDVTRLSAVLVDSASNAPHYANSPYYSSTSAVLEPVRPRMSDSLDAALDPTSSRPSRSEDGLQPGMSRQQCEFWEDTAVVACATMLQLPCETVSHLLRTYWTWINPGFMFVTREAFLREMATGGDHVSQLLLCAVFLHATRFTERVAGEDLLFRVRFLLGRELYTEPRISTIQSLLELSAYEIGKGASSQAWLFSGMAFRMAVDLGIFTAHKSSSHHDQVRQRSVRQLAWSCYLWDKAISLYLGRVPALPQPPSFDPPFSSDAEYDMWTPYHEGTDRSQSLQPMPSHVGACFLHFCKLAIIVNDVLLTIYGKKPPGDILSFVESARRRLCEWQCASPQYLMIVPGNVEQACPPPHIVRQNILYHTTNILLHRPFRADECCRSICRGAAEAVEGLILLYDNAYGLSRATYQMAYCAYTAATVAILDLQDCVPGQLDRVNTYLRVLYGIRNSCPSIQRSIDIILRTINASSEFLADPVSNMSHPAQLSRRVEPDPLPAFLFDQCRDATTSDMGAFGDLPFGELDAFPVDWLKLSSEMPSSFD